MRKAWSIPLPFLLLYKIKDIASLFLLSPIAVIVSASISLFSFLLPTRPISLKSIDQLLEWWWVQSQVLQEYRGQMRATEEPQNGRPGWKILLKEKSFQKKFYSKRVISNQGSILQKSMQKSYKKDIQVSIHPKASMPPCWPARPTQDEPCEDSESGMQFTTQRHNNKCYQVSTMQP